MKNPNMKPRRRDVLIGTAAFAAGSMVTPWLGNGVQAATPKRGGTLKMVVFPEPSSLLAIGTTGGGERIVSAKATEGLLTYDFDLNPLPQLATAWSVSPDGKEFRFELRKNVRWHDGKDFTSADVAYSILLVKEIHPRPIDASRLTSAHGTRHRSPTSIRPQAPHGGT